MSMRKCLCVLVFFLALPAFATPQAVAMVRATKLLAAFLADYAAGKLLDKALGLDMEKELGEVKAQLQAQIDAGSADRAQLRRQLDLVETQLRSLQMVRAIDAYPTKEEFEAFHASVKQALAQQQQLNELQREIDTKQNEQLDAQAAELADLREWVDKHDHLPPAVERDTRQRMLPVAPITAYEPDRRPNLRGTFLSAGIGYGSIREEENSSSNDNRPIGLARLGWRFNPHFAIGLEGSYWETSTHTFDLADGRQVRLDQPFGEMAATAALPIYLTLHERFPLTIYAGPGFAWESRDILSVNDAGAVLARHKARGSGFAVVIGAGFEFRLGDYSTLSILARGIRTKMESLSVHDTRSTASQLERTLTSATAALTVYF